MTALGHDDRARKEMAMHHRLKAEYEIGKKRYEQAAGHYEKALAYHPRDPAVLKALISLLRTKLDDPGKADYYQGIYDRQSEN